MRHLISENFEIWGEPNSGEKQGGGRCCSFRTCWEHEVAEHGRAVWTSLSHSYSCAHVHACTCVSVCLFAPVHTFASVLGLCLHECRSELVFQVSSLPSPPFSFWGTLSHWSWSSLAGWASYPSSPSYLSSYQFWDGGMWTQVLGLVQQALYPLSHAPAPRNLILRYLTLNI